MRACSMQPRVRDTSNEGHGLPGLILLFNRSTPAKGKTSLFLFRPASFILPLTSERTGPGLRITARISSHSLTGLDTNIVLGWIGHATVTYARCQSGSYACSVAFSQEWSLFLIARLAMLALYSYSAVLILSVRSFSAIS